MYVSMENRASADNDNMLREVERECVCVCVHTGPALSLCLCGPSAGLHCDAPHPGSSPAGRSCPTNTKQ